MFQEFIEQVSNFDCIGVFSHIRPDGDCIGAQVAVSRWLEKNGIRAMAFNDSQIPQNLEWLTEFHPIEIPDAELTAQCDAFIVVDGNAPHRFGSYETYQNEFPRPSYMIDHHPEPDLSAFNISISEDKASSTCELVYKLFREHDLSQIDSGTAMALYTGVITDTGSLQFDSVTPETLEITADLLRRGGFRPNEIIDRVSLALDTIRLYENNQIAIMYVTDGMLRITHTTNEDCEGLVSYPLSIAGIKAAVLLKDIDGHGIKMSLRSRSEIDVNEWAKKLDGGGHKKAAGGWHPGPLESAIKDVVKIGVRQIKKIENESVFP